MQWRDVKTMCVNIEEENGFVGPVWSRYIETSYEEEVSFRPKDAPLTIGAGEVELYEGK